VGPEEGFKVIAVNGNLFKTRSQVTVADQYQSSSSSQKYLTIQVTDAQAKEVMGALSSMSSGQKAPFLICPSSNTTAEPGTAQSSPATATAPATTRKS
jgi:hypothetical protein